MQTASARYGRPKGTGLDDRKRLESIAAALVADPKLRPTTAIRALGIDDPSTIRRLRDKFNLEYGKLMAEARRAARAKSSSTQREVAKLAQLAQSGIDIEPVIKPSAIADALPEPKSSPLPSLDSPAEFAACGLLRLGSVRAEHRGPRPIDPGRLLAAPSGGLDGDEGSAHSQRGRGCHVHAEQRPQSLPQLKCPDALSTNA